ncbi:hypothetical protein CPB85DRAFT_1288557 [Mucidula mucida]|nr:hypothetical protein CPB85DRAFT_1288557 [Mucidula mucida]
MHSTTSSRLSAFRSHPLVMTGTACQRAYCAYSNPTHILSCIYALASWARDCSTCTEAKSFFWCLTLSSTLSRQCPLSGTSGSSPRFPRMCSRVII